MKLMAQATLFIEMYLMLYYIIFLYIFQRMSLNMYKYQEIKLVSITSNLCVQTNKLLANVFFPFCLIKIYFAKNDNFVQL